MTSWTMDAFVFLAPVEFINSTSFLSSLFTLPQAVNQMQIEAALHVTSLMWLLRRTAASKCSTSFSNRDSSRYKYQMSLNMFQIIKTHCLSSLRSSKSYQEVSSAVTVATISWAFTIFCPINYLPLKRSNLVSSHFAKLPHRKLNKCFQMFIDK